MSISSVARGELNCPRTVRAAGRESLRVLHVMPSLVGGGMESGLVQLVHASAQPGRQDGIAHAVCVLRDGSDDLLAQCRSCVPTWVLGKGRQNNRRDWRAWWRLRQVIRSFGPNVVHARSTGAWFDAAAATLGRKNVRLLLAFHGRTDLSPVGWRRRQLNRWATRRAHAVLAVSRESARMMRQDWGVALRKLRTIPDGVNTGEFQPAEGPEEVRRIRRQLDLQEKDHLAICVARLVPIKGIDLLLRAWRQVSMVDRSARLLIVGDGPLRGPLEQQAEELACNSTVRFLGHRRDVPQLLRAADLFVLASRYEGTNNAVQQAMATGLPVVACRVGGMPELLTPDRTGWLVPPEAPDRLAETILAALLHKLDRQRIGQAAREAALKDFDLDTWVNRYASLYRELAARPRLPAEPPTEDPICAA